LNKGTFCKIRLGDIPRSTRGNWILFAPTMDRPLWDGGKVLHVSSKKEKAEWEKNNSLWRQLGQRGRQAEKGEGAATENKKKSKKKHSWRNGVRGRGSVEGTTMIPKEGPILDQVWEENFA